MATTLQQGCVIHGGVYSGGAYPDTYPCVSPNNQVLRHGTRVHTRVYTRKIYPSTYPGIYPKNIPEYIYPKNIPEYIPEKYTRKIYPSICPRVHTLTLLFWDRTSRFGGKPTQKSFGWFVAPPKRDCGVEKGLTRLFGILAQPPSTQIIDPCGTFL